MNRQKQFDQYLSSGFADVNAGDESRRHMAEMFEHNYSRFLPKNKKAKILDFGCGVGQCSEWLVAKGYKNVTAVDTSKEAIEYVKQRGVDGVQVKNTLDWLDKNKRQYDLIVTNDVIEHLDKDQIIPIVTGWHKALKKGGTLIVKTNNVSAITGARMRYWDHTHTTSFTEFSLLQVLSYAGCNNIELKPFSFPLNKITRMIRRFLQAIVHIIWKLIFWLEYTIVPKIVHEYFFAVVKKK